MKKFVLFAAPILVLGIAVLAVSGGLQSIRETLTGYEEVPAVSTAGSGQFTAQISKNEDSIAYELSYSGTESTVLQAHIHFGQRSVNGGISVWLCGNPSVTPPVNPPAGVQACPPAPATITGTIVPANVIGPAGQGIAGGQFEELIEAMRSGVTYVNVHTADRPGGEIRSQIDLNEKRHH